AVLANNGAKVTFSTCSFVNNISNRDGGAMEIIGSATTVIGTNCTFAGNSNRGRSTNRHGGAIMLNSSGGSLSLYNCTIVNNETGSGGGGGINVETGTLNMTNTLIANNVEGSIGNDLEFRNNANAIRGNMQTNLVENCEDNGQGQCNPNFAHHEDPQLMVAATCGSIPQTYFEPQASSPVIRNGTPPGGNIPSVDICGNARTGSTPIGSFHLSPLPIITLSVNPASINENDGTNLIYQFNRIEGDIGNDLTVNFNVNGTATTDDFTIITGGTGNVTYDSGTKTGSITFPANVMTIDLVVSPTGDLIVEEDDTVQVNIAAQILYELGAPNFAKGGILDDDCLENHITGKNISICLGQSIDLDTMVNGSFNDTVNYSTIFGNWTNQNIVTPSTTTTYFIRDSVRTVDCVDTAKVIITVLTPPNSNNHPSPDTTCIGKDASFMATGTNGESGILTYQWQESMNNGTSFNDIIDGGIFSNSTTTTLNLADVQTTHDAHQYRLIVTETTGTVECIDTSNAATLQVFSKPVINTQPSSIIICENENTFFEVVATENDGGVLSYQWQESTDGTNFSNISDTAPFNGTSTDTLNLTNVATSKNTFLYRVIIIETVGTIACTDTSDVVMLTVNPIDTSERAQAICQNEPFTFNEQELDVAGVYLDTLMANSTGCDSIIRLTLTVNPIDTSELVDTICINQTYSFNNQDLNTNGIYLDTLMAASTGCDSIIRLTLTVNPLSVGGTIDGSAIVCQQYNSNILTLSGEVGGILGWQSATDETFSNPVNIENTNNILTMVTVNETSFFRAIVQSGTCAVVFSDTASIMIDDSDIDGDNIPDCVGLCNDTSEIMNIFGAPIESGTYQAAFVIKSDGDVPSDGDITFKAGESILLQPGFHASLGSSFLATIEACVIPQNIIEENELVGQSFIAIPQPIETEALTLKVQPNPFTQVAQVYFRLPKEDVVSIAVFDQSGRLVKEVLKQENYPEGDYYVKLEANQLYGGMHYVILQSSRERLVQKVIVVNDGRYISHHDD
ncbi:MAG: 3-coathanger stack domain-containing protein, partial [Bacteroidota bacterium]